MSRESSVKETNTGKKRKDNKVLILQAAEKEFAEFGFRGASIMSIAKRANVPRPNVHYYFKNKLALYNAVLIDILSLWNDSFNQFSADDDPAVAIAAYIRAKVMHSKSHPNASKIFANEILQGAPHLSDYLNNDIKDWLQEKTAVIQTWIEQGKMDAIQPFYLIFLIWGATQHYADFDTQITTVLGKEKLSDSDFEDIANDLVHIIVKGCGIKTTSIL